MPLVVSGGRGDNALLSRSKGRKGGWIVITAGWACRVTIAVYAVNALNGAHLNPAVRIVLASIASSSRRASAAAAQRGQGAELAVFCRGPRRLK
jgi:glycerol uptake facilitator-like aquaporin